MNWRFHQLLKCSIGKLERCVDLQSWIIWSKTFIATQSFMLLAWWLLRKEHETLSRYIYIYIYIYMRSSLIHKQRMMCLVSRTYKFIITGLLFSILLVWKEHLHFGSPHNVSVWHVLLYARKINCFICKGEFFQNKSGKS